MQKAKLWNYPEEVLMVFIGEHTVMNLAELKFKKIQGCNVKQKQYKNWKPNNTNDTWVKIVVLVLFPVQWCFIFKQQKYLKTENVRLEECSHKPHILGLLLYPEHFPPEKKNDWPYYMENEMGPWNGLSAFTEVLSADSKLTSNRFLDNSPHNDSECYLICFAYWSLSVCYGLTNPKLTHNAKWPLGPALVSMWGCWANRNPKVHSLL